MALPFRHMIDSGARARERTHEFIVHDRQTN